MKKKIALCGQMGAGKDFAAKLLIDDYGFIRYAFGDHVKAYAQIMFPNDFEDGKKPRRIMQMFGQSMRAIDPDIWVNLLMQDIEDSETMRQTFGEVDGRYVVTDLRQPNEYDRLKAEGFTIVRIAASFETRLERLYARGDKFDVDSLHHETESYIAGYDVDYEIENDGISADELQLRLESILFSTDTTKGEF